MSACRRGCQTNVVALALYCSECQFSTLTLPHAHVKTDPCAAAFVQAPGSAGYAAVMAVTGSEESAAKSSADGAAPRDTSSEPSAATIAPLSVQSPGRGTRSTMPAAAHRSAASARSRELAATPPPITRWSTPLARPAATAFFVSTSATASWNEAATSATGTGSPAVSRASTHLATAVFSPEKEKSLVPSAYLPRGKAI